MNDQKKHLCGEGLPPELSGQEQQPRSGGDPGGGASDTGVDEQLLHLFHRAGTLLRRQAHHHGGMDHGQGRLLHILREEGDMPQRRLRDLFQVRAGSLSEMLGKLEQKGLIERERDEADRRAAHIRLTPKGRALVREDADTRTSLACSLFAPLDVEERESLLRILRKMLASWLEEPGASPRHCGHGGGRRHRR